MTSTMVPLGTDEAVRGAEDAGLSVPRDLRR